jgi:hypothetical protein
MAAKVRQATGLQLSYTIPAAQDTPTGGVSSVAGDPSASLLSLRRAAHLHTSTSNIGHSSNDPGFTGGALCMVYVI